MIKCIYDQCQWPECDKTCGLVPTGDYVAGSCAEEKLIAHLQGRIEDLMDTLKASQLYASSLLLSLSQVTRQVQDFKAFVDTDSYVPTCPHGCCDCVYDPAYIRKHYPDWWKDLGMPTSCENCPNGERYDDEDK